LIGRLSVQNSGTSLCLPKGASAFSKNKTKPPESAAAKGAHWFLLGFADVLAHHGGKSIR
jgi:hypothetical protein